MYALQDEPSVFGTTQCQWREQVFTNAFLFNPKESNVAVMATFLQVRRLLKFGASALVARMHSTATDAGLLDPTPCGSPLWKECTSCRNAALPIVLHTT